MEDLNFNLVPEDMKGKIVEEAAVTDYAVVIKFTDGTYLDIYLDKSMQILKTSTNKLNTK